MRAREVSRLRKERLWWLEQQHVVVKQQHLRNTRGQTPPLQGAIWQWHSHTDQLRRNRPSTRIANAGWGAASGRGERTQTTIGSQLISMRVPLAWPEEDVEGSE